MAEEGSLLCRLPPPPCRLDAREPEAEPDGAWASSNKRSRRDGIWLFIAEKRRSIEGEGAPAAAAGASSPRTGDNRAEDPDVDRAEDDADRDCRDDAVGAAAAADAGGAADDDSNRLPRVDLSEDAMIEVADEASFAFSFSCFSCGVRENENYSFVSFDRNNAFEEWQRSGEVGQSATRWCKQAKDPTWEGGSVAKGRGEYHRILERITATRHIFVFVPMHYCSLCILRGDGENTGKPEAGSM